MIWFTADFHLSHRNIIKYCNRPFRDVEDMDNIIIKNMISKIKSGDTLYFLGDLTFKVDLARKFFESFKNVKIYFLIGNHDSTKVIKLAEEYCESVSHLKNIQINNQSITLCHYAMRVWNKSHFNSWQLYGHSHGTLTPIGKQYDVGIDTNKFYPISFDELVDVMEQKQNNFNYIPPEKRNRLN